MTSRRITWSYEDRIQQISIDLVEDPTDPPCFEISCWSDECSSPVRSLSLNIDQLDSLIAALVTG